MSVVKTNKEYGSYSYQSWTPTKNYTNESFPQKRARTFTSSDLVRGDRKTPNPYSYTVVETNTPSGSITVDAVSTVTGAWRHSTVQRGIQTGYGLSPLAVPSNESVLCQNQALANLYQQIKGSSQNLAVDLGEIDQTNGLANGRKRSYRNGPKLALSGGAWGVIPDAYNAVTTYPVHGANIIGNRYLEWAFGWRPLVNTIWGLVDQQDLFRDTSPTYSVKGRSVRQGQVDSKSGLWAADDKLVVRETDWKIMHEYGVQYRVSSPELLALQRVMSLNPALIAWELLPFSFVVDWVYDVGGYLEAAEAALGLGLTFHSGYHSSLIRRESRGRWVGNRTYVSGLERLTENVSIQATGTNVEFVRERLWTFPFPSAPKINPDLGSSSLLATAAYLATFLGRK